MKIDLFTSSNENIKELFVKHGYLIPSNNFITQALSEIQTELEKISAILNVPFWKIQIAQNLEINDSNIESSVDEQLIMEPLQNEYSAPLLLSSNAGESLEEDCTSDNQEVLQNCENRVGNQEIFKASSSPVSLLNYSGDFGVRKPVSEFNEKSENVPKNFDDNQRQSLDSSSKSLLGKSAEDRTKESVSVKQDECISQTYEDETETSANSKLLSEGMLDSVASGFSLDSIDALEEVSFYESEEGDETYNSSFAESKSEDYAYDGHEEIRGNSHQNIPSIVVEDIDSEPWSSKSMLSPRDSQASEAEQELTYMLAAIDCLYYNSQDTTETAAEKLEKLKVRFLF